MLMWQWRHGQVQRPYFALCDANSSLTVQKGFTGSSAECRRTHRCASAIVYCWSELHRSHLSANTSPAWSLQLLVRLILGVICKWTSIMASVLSPHSSAQAPRCRTSACMAQSAFSTRAGSSRIQGIASHTFRSSICATAFSAGWMVDSSRSAVRAQQQHSSQFSCMAKEVEERLQQQQQQQVSTWFCVWSLARELIPVVNSHVDELASTHYAVSMSARHREAVAAAVVTRTWCTVGIVVPISSFAAQGVLFGYDVNRAAVAHFRRTAQYRRVSPLIEVSFVSSYQVVNSVSDEERDVWLRHWRHFVRHSVHQVCIKPGSEHGAPHWEAQLSPIILFAVVCQATAIRTGLAPRQGRCGGRA